MLRRRCLAEAMLGAVYVPFIGDGDLAVALYRDRMVYGADIDSTRIATAASRISHGSIIVADCNEWPFPNCVEAFAIADCDAYGNPYQAFVAFWAHARKTPRVVVFGTDGLRQRMKRAKVLKELPT